MHCRSIMGRKSPTLYWMLLISSFWLLTPLAMSQTMRQPAGELSYTRQATLDGITAISGSTVLSGSRLKTAIGGAVVVNLGQLGRLELGPETEIALSFSAESIGGRLLAGHVVVSAPAKVGISILTPDGAITSDRQQSAVLTVNVAPERTRFSVLQHKAKLSVGSQVEELSAGQEITASKQALAQGALRSQLVVSNSARPTVEAFPASGKAVNLPSQGTVTAASLLNGSIAESLAIIFGRLPKSGADYISTAITCKDFFDDQRVGPPKCLSTSRVKP